LEAQDAVEALTIVVRHSRRIHLLLAEDHDETRVVAATLKPYRPDTNVVYVGSKLEHTSILTEVSQILDPPVQGFQNDESSGTNLRAALTGKVDAARRRFLDSSRNFLEVTKDVPSGAPHPDSRMRIQRPADARRRAFAEYLKARKQLEDHIAAERSRSKSK
jgi:hypothetical protein